MLSQRCSQIKCTTFYGQPSMVPNGSNRDKFLPCKALSLFPRPLPSYVAPVNLRFSTQISRCLVGKGTKSRAQSGFNSDGDNSGEGGHSGRTKMETMAKEEKEEGEGGHLGSRCNFREVIQGHRERQEDFISRAGKECSAV